MAIIAAIMHHETMVKLSFPYIPVAQHKRAILLTRMSAGVLSSISYVAVRGQSPEDGAVQRVLNQRRIASIRDFTIAGGDYPGAIVLNWVSTTNPLEKNGSNISFEVESGTAQIVDGQHRVAGIRAAIVADPKIGDLELCVAIYENLNTKECADIFLSINTEQKPVDRSLVFDLYGIASEPLVDAAAVRARDIAMFLNESEESPYTGWIKLPGSARRKGGIALSTVVAAIKPLVESKGIFEQLGVTELEGQKRIILNLFSALKSAYGKDWDENNNVFQYAAGFVGAVEFLKLKLVPYCTTKSSFEISTILNALKFESNNLIRQPEVRGRAGSEASNLVFDRLVQLFTPETATPELRF